jgi:hypothetical protein
MVTENGILEVAAAVIDLLPQISRITVTPHPLILACFERNSALNDLIHLGIAIVTATSGLSHFQPTGSR